MTAIIDLAHHPEKFVTIAELAAYWRLSQRAVQYYVAKGALPATRVGRNLRIATADAIAFGRPADVVEGPVASVRSSAPHQ